MKAAIQVEALKLRRSPVGIIATLAIVVGTIALLGGITAGVASGNPELIAQAGPAAALDWSGVLMGAHQITAVAAMLGSGVVLAWLFAREFAEGTITGLFGLPVSRGRLALAKLTVYFVWAVLISTALAVAVLALGLLLGYGAPHSEAWAEIGRLWALTMLSAGIAVPVAWIATLTRSLLAAIGATITLVIISQIGALAGAGAWMPPAAPGLWAMSGGADATMVQLALTIALVVASVVLTRTSWSRLQLDR